LVFLGASCDADATGQSPVAPEVADASDEAEQSMAGISIPDAWQISLFAAEPNVANIVAFDIDHRGRLFVAESFRQNRGVTDNRAHDENWLLADLSAETVQDRIDYHKRLLGDGAIAYAQHDDRVRRVVDVDGDGHADHSTVLASGFHRLEEGTGAGVLARGNEVFYTCIPKLWKLIDDDDDGEAEERIVMSDGYGVRVAFRGHDLHGLIVGPDGRLYFSIGDRGYKITKADGQVLADPASGAVFRCELDGSNLEVYATGLRNPQELAFNDVGDLFTVDNNSDSGDMARVVHLLQDGDSGWRMYYQYLPDRGPFNRDKLWEPLHADQPAYIVPPIANLTDGPSGLAYYPGTGFGDRLNDTFLVCDFRGGAANSGIRSFKLDADGAFYGMGEDDQLVWNVLATDLAFGPEGSLYVSDWVDGWDGVGKGRMYRLSDPQHSESEIVRQVHSRLSSDWSQRPTDQLADDLAHVDRRVRLESQWELARRGETEVLVSVATDVQADLRSRLHAIWGLDQVLRREDSEGSTGPDAIAKIRGLLTDEHSEIRAAAAKFVGDNDAAAAIDPLLSLVKDPSARVQYFAIRGIASLLRHPDAQAQKGLADRVLPHVIPVIAEHANSDPALRHAGVMLFAALENPGQLQNLSTYSDVAVRRSVVVALRRLRSGHVAKLLSDEDPQVVAEAARAIHDTPIAVAMGALAKLNTSGMTDKEVLHRVLNANFQLGTAENATTIASIASHVATPKETRIEALKMLGDWSQPGPYDRVLNQYRPLASRPPKAAADALQPHINDLIRASASVRDTAIEVAASLGLKSIVPQLAKRVKDKGLGPSVRATALKALSDLDPPSALALAREVPLTPTTALVPAALEVIARGDRVASVETFIEATRLRDTTARQLAWDIIRGIESPAAVKAIEQGVSDYLSGELPSDVRLNVREAAKDRVSAELSEQLKAYDQELAQSDPLGPWLDSAHGGNADLGRKLFFEKTELSCVRCHKVDRAGGEVGPNLTLIGKEKDEKYLLEAICLPSATIAKGYETAVIATEAGDVLTGIVRSENDDEIELLMADGTQKRIDQVDVVARRKGNSSMPTDLAKLITPRELRDLVAYLKSLQVDPRAKNATE
tara:strand:- start:150082 stop:153423 length:3342 start_codon:yes stop_codon:yes gene_type:complete